MLKYWLLAIPALLFGAQGIASESNFCPSVAAHPKQGSFAVFNKEVSGRTYVIAAARPETVERTPHASIDGSLEARRQIIGKIEGRTIGSNENFMASYRFVGLETHKVTCAGRSLVLFIQDQSKLQKVESSASSSAEMSSGYKPDPFSSAEENLMDALRNKR